MRLAVDALNLPADRRGMGRFVRAALRELHDAVGLTLLVRNRAAERELRAELPPDVAFAAPQTAGLRDRYDAVWCPWNGIRFPTAAPAIVTICDDFAFRFPARDPLARYREQQPVRRALGRAARLTTISAWSRAALAERFALEPRRFAILPLAPDPFFFPAAGPAPAVAPFVLVVGGREPRKRVAWFAQTFAAAFADGGARLVLVGPDGVRADDETLRRLYRTARVVAVPSLAEGFGLVAVEAQACGAAVLASDATALPEVVTEPGALIAPDDRAGWIAALRRAVADEAFVARLRAAGARRFAEAPRRVIGAALLELLAGLRDERA